MKLDNFYKDVYWTLDKLNQQVAGTGFQFATTKTKFRVENENGELLFYSRNLPAAIEKCIPNGCGGTNTLEALLQLVKENT